MSTRSKPNDRFTEYDPPWVEEVPGEPFRYRVESRSGRQFHTVDLTDREGHGACDCEFYRFTADPNLRRHGNYIPHAKGRHGVTECVHIRAALDHLHLHVTQPMLASFHAGIPADPVTP